MNVTLINRYQFVVLEYLNQNLIDTFIDGIIDKHVSSMPLVKMIVTFFNIQSRISAKYCRLWNFKQLIYTIYAVFLQILTLPLHYFI
jgi:hypothetical protein